MKLPSLILAASWAASDAVARAAPPRGAPFHGADGGVGLDIGIET